MAESKDRDEEAPEEPEEPRAEPDDRSRRREGSGVVEADDRGLADKIGDGLMWALALAGVGFIIWTLTLGVP